MKNFKVAPSESTTETAWAVNCPECGKVFMTYEFYMDQLACADRPWLCPRCFTNADFDNANWDKHTPQPLQSTHECPNCNGTGVDKGVPCSCQE